MPVSTHPNPAHLGYDSAYKFTFGVFSMLIVLPSDPTTQKASAFLTQHQVAHQVIDLPETLDYKTGANLAIWLHPPVGPSVLTDLSAAGFVIMRVFRQYQLPQENAL